VVAVSLTKKLHSLGGSSVLDPADTWVVFVVVLWYWPWERA
jgi:hypothetical protein